jgi:hypothetical protein
MKNQPQVQVLSREATGLPVADLDEMERLAKAAMPPAVPARWYSGADFTTDGFPRIDADFMAFCTPERVAQLVAVARAYDRINTPEIDDFLSAVKNEALHQRERWGIENDGGKEPSDWFWLVGYLAGKALHDVKGKRLHHIITAGAALLNWHAHAIGAYARMRPGIESPDTETANA